MEKFKLGRVQAIGLFVLITLIATFAVVNFLKGEDIFNSSTVYNATFESVDGLTVTGPVYIRGLKVGMVEGIEYNMEKDCFDVEFKVKSKFLIPDNSVAEIYSADIMGTKALRINMGDSKTYAKSGDVLTAAIQPDMVASLMSTLEPLTSKAEELIGNLNVTLNSVNSLLDSSAREDIKSSLASLDVTLANAAKLSAALNGMSPELEGIVANLEKLSKGLADGAGDIQGSLANVNTITSQLSEAELGKTVESLKNLVEKLQDPNGSIGKMLATDSLHNSVNNLLKDVDILVQRITENPKKYIKVSVF